jgi:hypothetical protein
MHTDISERIGAGGKLRIHNLRLTDCVSHRLSQFGFVGNELVAHARAFFGRPRPLFRSLMNLPSSA